MADPLILISGLNNTREVFDGLSAELAPDVQTHIYEPPALDTVEAIATDFLSGAPERFWLAGFSFGGYVALAVLEQAPERVLGFALIGATPAADTEARREGRSKLIAAAREGRYPAIVENRAPGVFHPAHEEDKALNATRRRMFQGYGAERFIAHNRATQARPDRHGTLDLLENRPLLLAAGEKDPLAPASDLEAIAARHKNARVTIVPGAAHLVPMEQPRALAAALRSWIAA